MKPHRDNTNSHGLTKMGRGEELGEEGNVTGATNTGELGNSQKVGTNVLVYTAGCSRPQTFTIAFAPSNGPGCIKDHYVVKPIMQMECGPGTLSVLDPLDGAPRRLRSSAHPPPHAASLSTRRPPPDADTICTHGTDWTANYQGPDGGWRVAFTMRWLTNAQNFYAEREYDRARGLALPTHEIVEAVRAASKKHSEKHGIDDARLYDEKGGRDATKTSLLSLIGNALEGA